MAEKTLLDEALEAFGIGEKHVLNSRIDGDTVTIVTKGGARVSYKKGDKVEKLDQVRIDGISRKKTNVVAGKKK